MRYLAAVGLLVLTSIAVWQGVAPVQDTPLTATSTEQAIMSSYVIDGRRTHFAQNGSATDVLEIDSATRWTETDRTELKGIRYVGQGNGGQRWQVEAAVGHFFENQNELALRGGVEIQELNQRATMTTDTMRLYMDDRRAEGLDPVTLTGQGSVTTGSSFELDLNTSTATLKGDVTTHYE